MVMVSNPIASDGMSSACLVLDLERVPSRRNGSGFQVHDFQAELARLSSYSPRLLAKSFLTKLVSDPGSTIIIPVDGRTCPLS